MDDPTRDNLAAILPSNDLDRSGWPTRLRQTAQA
jgi:hypothetical protein